MADDFTRTFDFAIRTGDVSTVMAMFNEADEKRMAPLSPGTLGRTALWYARRGVPVFPVQANGKTPLTKRGLLDASTDDEIVSGWWKSWPSANIGAVTGVKFDVLDVDGTEGVESLLALGTVAWLGRVITPRYNGYHLYRKPSGMWNAASWKAGLDYRGKGGYVVVPPSVGVNSKRYAWVEPPTFLEKT